MTGGFSFSLLNEPTKRNSEFQGQSMIELKLQQAEKRYQELSDRLNHPATFTNSSEFQKIAKEIREKHPNKKLVILTEPHINGLDKYVVAYEQKRLKNGKYYHGDLIEQVLLY